MGLYGTIKGSNVILGGELNFIVSSRDIWGHSAWVDPLGPFIIDFFKDNGLVDIEPMELRPTWRNGRASNEGIGKRLNRFYMAK